VAENFFFAEKVLKKYNLNEIIDYLLGEGSRMLK